MPIVHEKKKYYSLEEVATLFNVTKGAVTKYHTNGKMSGTYIRGRKYFTEEDMKKFLLNNA